MKNVLGVIASVFFQDQVSADMYNFVAKEIDYANYFQTVSVSDWEHVLFCIIPIYMIISLPFFYLLFW